MISQETRKLLTEALAVVPTVADGLGRSYRLRVTFPRSNGVTFESYCLDPDPITPVASVTVGENNFRHIRTKDSMIKLLLWVKRRLEVILERGGILDEEHVL